jgi:membrane-associated phospholipid phosphatase
MFSPPEKERDEKQDNQTMRLRPEQMRGISLPQVSLMWRMWLFVPVIFVAGGLVALGVDCRLAKWCLDYHWPAFARELFQIGECFGNGLGAALVILAVFQLSSDRRRLVPRVIAITFGSGVAAVLVKLLIVRVRPHHFDFAGGVWQTFGDWLPIGSGGSGLQSFPSGHTAVAVGLAIALAWLYPRGFWWFFSLAFLAAAHRVTSGAHYLSDVLFAAAVASTVALGCLRMGPLPTWFQRWESSQKMVEPEVQ